MLSPDKSILTPFSDDALYQTVKETLVRYGMDKMIEGGVLLGLSGGADSVMLLHFLLEYRKREEQSFNIVACHVNHMIRGEEASRDMAFSKELASIHGVEFIAVEVNVPEYAKEHKLGIEEAAREVRYSAFDKIISGRNDISAIALAHNASDNVETVIFNMMRGAGLLGMCGIAPVRDNIVRPLIRIPKGEILERLHKCSIEYVNDSTNNETDYTRNYIRHEIVPRLSRLSTNPEGAVARLTESLIEDNLYLSAQADGVICELENEESFPVTRLCHLEYPILSRVLSGLIQNAIGTKPSVKLISDVIGCLDNDNFAYSVGKGYSILCERGRMKITRLEAPTRDFNEYPLKEGVNILADYDGAVVISSKITDISPNVYNFSIHVDVPSAIINGDMYLRFRRDGDAYRYGGMTHKLKKVFNDKDISAFARDRIPVICDADGILWVPGLPARQTNFDFDKSDTVRIALFYSSDNNKERLTLSTDGNGADRRTTGKMELAICQKKGLDRLNEG